MVAIAAQPPVVHVGVRRGRGLLARGRSSGRRHNNGRPTLGLGRVGGRALLLLLLLLLLVVVLLLVLAPLLLLLLVGSQRSDARRGTRPRASVLPLLLRRRRLLACVVIQELGARPALPMPARAVSKIGQALQVPEEGEGQGPGLGHHDAAAVGQEQEEEQGEQEHGCHAWGSGGRQIYRSIALQASNHWSRALTYAP